MQASYITVEELENYRMNADGLLTWMAQHKKDPSWVVVVKSLAKMLE